MIRDTLVEFNQTCCSLLQNLKFKQKLKIFKPYDNKKKVQTLKPEYLETNLQRKTLKTSISLKQLKKRRELNSNNLINEPDYQTLKRVTSLKPDSFQKIKNVDRIQKSQRVSNLYSQPNLQNLSYYPSQFCRSPQSPTNPHQIIPSERKSATYNITFSYHNKRQEYQGLKYQNNTTQMIEPLPLHLINDRSNGYLASQSARTVVSVIVETEQSDSVILERISSTKNLLQTQCQY